jgi:large subunit ribosomal protein L10
MIKQDKIYQVEDIIAKIKDAKAVALADYRGITVSQATQLRKKVIEAGGQLQVIKNTLLLRALKKNNYSVDEEKLEGPTMVLFANQDEISPIKSLAVFAKSLEGKLPWKVGFMNGKTLSVEELTQLTNIPARIELQARFVGLLFSQPSRLAYALNYNQQKLVLALEAIKSKK